MNVRGTLQGHGTAVFTEIVGLWRHSRLAILTACGALLLLSLCLMSPCGMVLLLSPQTRSRWTRARSR